LTLSTEHRDDGPAPGEERVKVFCIVRLENRYIPQEEVAGYFCAADVVALPYLSGTQSGALSAALHFERPVVASNVGGLAEMIPPGAGTAVGPGDPAALREALEHWLGNGLGKEFSESVRRHGQVHTWTRFAAEISEMLRS
jgi:D-inositol-3-phosphate glycosyltransferase